MDDNTLMPFGKYKGTALANVPATYLLHLKTKGIAKGELLDYVDDNSEVLGLEVLKSFESRNTKTNHR